ncbi:MAG: flagellar hook-associated protein FlgK [Quinella sp. 1Q5]|nr:flagellar hook-associated protein FlgK [Quinella sp. 1Q5]
MRATFSGLNTMVRGIMANQLSLDTTGHNITNAGTEGYSRQTVTLATTYSEERGGLHGGVRVGTGVDVLAVERARNVYADIQYRNENPSQKYYETMAVNYDKLETIFDDSQNLGIESALNKFYQSWVDLSTNASNASSRTHVIEQGRNLSDLLQTATAELQEQIRSEYEDLKSEIKQVDDILNEIVMFNKQISAQEVTGATANDLRDRRDLLVDQLSNYMNVSFSENANGTYQINSGGVTLINGPTRAHLVMSDGVSSSAYGTDYGITDYNIKVKESNLVFTPQNGILKARFDSIAEDKAYIDKLADIASFMLTAFNEQHKQGWDMDGNSKVDSNGDTVPDTINFYGQGNINYQYRYDADFNKNYLYKDDDSLAPEDKLLSGVKIISELEVNAKFAENRGDRYIAAATSYDVIETTDADGNISRDYKIKPWNERTGDGTNAVYLSELFNISQDTIVSDGKANALIFSDNAPTFTKKMVLRDLNGNEILDANGNQQYATALTTLSVNSLYQKSMSTLGIDAYSTDVNYDGLQAIMTQITNWRDSTSGVDWNEELTNMIKFQKGFASCSRCLNAMDECLDRLVNSTGVVGR